jgi:hypothetical protein
MEFHFPVKDTIRGKRNLVEVQGVFVAFNDDVYPAVGDFAGIGMRLHAAEAAAAAGRVYQTASKAGRAEAA